MAIPTPHITAKAGEIAKTVLMPGDPLRSKFIAENFLENPVLVNNTRGVQGYTGTWKGVPVTVMASGMGIPSIGIYSWELYTEYGVENIILIEKTGSTGGNTSRATGGMNAAKTAAQDANEWKDATTAAVEKTIASAKASYGEQLADLIAIVEKQLEEYMDSAYSQVLEAIRTSGKLEKDTEEMLKGAIKELLKEFGKDL